jgi:HEAT repeats
MTALPISYQQKAIMSRAEDITTTSVLGADALASAGFGQRRTHVCNDDQLIWIAASAVPFVPVPTGASASAGVEEVLDQKLETRASTAFSRALEVARYNLPLLVSASPANRKALALRILRLSHPVAVTLVALQEYDRTAKESYLLHALSLLDSWGSAAWPALRWLAQLGRPECELFSGLIARCQGIPRMQRLEALALLAGNPHSAVRFSLLERLGEFGLEEASPILEKLTSDSDPDVRAEATERLQVLA